MIKVTITRLPRRLTAKQEFSKWVTGNRNANKKEEINEGEMQLASVTRKKVTNKNESTLRQLTDILDHNNCSPNRFVKKHSFRAYANRQKIPNKFCSIKTARTFNKNITINALCQAKAGQSHQHTHSRHIQPEYKKYRIRNTLKSAGQSFSQPTLHSISKTHNRCLNPDANTFSQQNLRTVH